MKKKRSTREKKRRPNSKEMVRSGADPRNIKRARERKRDRESSYLFRKKVR